MCIKVPILMTIYLRVYRLKRVFELYENYLKTMRVTLGNSLVNRQVQDLVSNSSYANRFSVLMKSTARYNLLKRRQTDSLKKQRSESVRPRRNTKENTCESITYNDPTD